MSPPAAQLLFELCFVCLRPILTNLFSVEHFCPLTIRVNRALISANLDYNDIGDEGAIAISAALESNTTLEDLSLKSYSSGAKITAVGAQAIAKMLVVNRALTSLDLRQNAIGVGGAEAIAAALPQS